MKETLLTILLIVWMLLTLLLTFSIVGWVVLMKVVLKVWSECSFLEDSILQDDLEYFLGSANKEKTLDKLIEIVKIKTEIDGD